jgi:DNA-binding NarL/FixJ family response regulator
MNDGRDLIPAAMIDLGGKASLEASIANRPLSGKRARILLVEDHALVRFGLASLIDQQTDMEVCGEAEDCAKGLEAIHRLNPDLVVVDIFLKHSSGLDLVRQAKAEFPDLPVLVLTAHEEPTYVATAFRAGAVGYLMKHEALSKFLVAVRRVLGGELCFSAGSAADLLQQPVQGEARMNLSSMGGLSGREPEVFQRIGQWKGTRQIAAELGLSIKAVEYYRARIKRKLGLKTGTQLTKYATARIEQRG